MSADATEALRMRHKASRQGKSSKPDGLSGPCRSQDDRCDAGAAVRGLVPLVYEAFHRIFFTIFPPLSSNINGGEIYR
jgi:hypothetical protein